MTTPDIARREALGPAERIINTLLTYADHMIHSRAGLVVPDHRAVTGVRWVPVTHKLEEGQKVVYELSATGKGKARKNVRTRRGVLAENGVDVTENGVKIGYYLKPRTHAPGANPFPEVATWMYRQVAEIYKLDNEFVARWASWSFPKEHKDLKVILTAFLLVQSRKGDAIKENGETIFRDEDYRAVGEAMCLIRQDKDLDAKLLLRVGKVLRVPGIVAINRELGFTQSRHPALGRWPVAVRRWLAFRENNPRMLQGLVRTGMKETVKQLSREVQYKPTTVSFYETLRWKQKQAPQGHRTLALDMKVKQAETWEGLSEEAICERIMSSKPGWKRITGLIPASVGLTRAIMMASMEAGSISNADLLILTPTLEDLDLLKVPEVKARWDKANESATNQRTTNIARRVKDVAIVEQLEATASKAVTKAAEEVAKGLVLYVLVDISGSMTEAIETAIRYLSRFIGGWPLAKLHVAVFNTTGRLLTIRHPSKTGVEQAFKGIGAGGGTDYGSGIRAVQHLKPSADEDALILFVGDNDPDRPGSEFAQAVTASGLNPVAIALLEVGFRRGDVIDRTCLKLNLPVLRVNEQMFETEDPYSIVRTLRHLVASTPVGAGRPFANVAPRVTLIDEILKTELLQKPLWAQSVPA